MNNHFDSPKDTSGIYIHIPFCKQACHYCNFHFSTSMRFKEKLVAALIRELELQRRYLIHPPQTLYFGGGTPSILTVRELQQIFDAVYKFYPTNYLEEITIEVNPNDLNIDKLQEYKQLGINRLSIGVQSFCDDDLQFLNRSHNAHEAFSCIKMARQVGIENISIDLIYGIPNVTDLDWKRNILQALQLKIPHISCYCLTVEDKTALKHMIETNQLPNVDENQGAVQFSILMELMAEHGYIHYEISNFCRDPFFSKHNTSYWQGREYLGIGPSAHSFDGKIRQWNVANNAEYITAISQNRIPMEKEKLSGIQQLNEYIMTSIRTIWGCDLQKIKLLGGGLAIQHIMNKVRKFENNNIMYVKNDVVYLLPQGKMIADYITLELFLEEPLVGEQT